jgi:hypothetical protein
VRTNQIFRQYLVNQAIKSRLAIAKGKLGDDRGARFAYDEAIVSMNYQEYQAYLDAVKAVDY